MAGIFPVICSVGLDPDPPFGSARLLSAK